MGLRDRMAAKMSDGSAPRPEARSAQSRIQLDNLVDREDMEVELRRAELAKLHLRGYTTVAIARMLHMSHGVVCMELNMLKQRWATAAVLDIDASIREELDRLAHLESEYWAGWEASKSIMTVQPVKRNLRDRLASKSKGSAVPELEIEMAGDPSYLDGVLKCIERRCKILGLDAPMKIDVSERVRQMALAAGLDPEEAVLEAQKVIKEAKQEMTSGSRSR